MGLPAFSISITAEVISLSSPYSANTYMDAWYSKQKPKDNNRLQLRLSVVLQEGPIIQCHHQQLQDNKTMIADVYSQMNTTNKKRH